MKQWFVGIAKVQQDWRAISGLREQGYRVFSPKRAVRVEIGRRTEARVVIRFEGYLFVQCGLDETGPIRSTPGMDGSSHESALVCEAGQKPLILNPATVETYHQIFDEEMARATARKRPDPRNDFHLGEMVKVGGSNLHPAYGLSGEFHGYPKRGRAIILVNFKPWEVAEIDLEPVEKPKAKAKTS